jgi:Ligase-CoA domain
MRCRCSAASLAGNIEVEEAADYLYQNGIVAYAYSTEIPVAVLGAKYKWARGAGLIQNPDRQCRSG